MNALTGQHLLDTSSLSSPADQDAQLLADIARATELDNEWNVLWQASADAVDGSPHKISEREHWAKIEPEWADLRGRIYATRSNTSEGLLAKARFFVDCLGAGESDSEQSLICDILDADGHFGPSVPAGSAPSTMHMIGLRLGEIDREITDHCGRDRESILETERAVLERAILSSTPVTAGDAIALQLVALSYIASLADGCEPLGESMADRMTWVGQALATGLRTLAMTTGINVKLMGEDYYISGPITPEEPAAECGLTSAAPVGMNPAGTWPKSLFPPGQHPTDATPCEIEPDDCDLIDLCDEFDRLEDACTATFAKGNPGYIRNQKKRDKANDPRIQRQEEIAPLIAATPAHTDAGVIAKLRSFAKWDKEILKPDHQCSMAEIILSSACRDAMQGDAA